MRAKKPLGLAGSVSTAVTAVTVSGWSFFSMSELESAIILIMDGWEVKSKLRTRHTKNLGLTA